ncbi:MULTISPECIES: hypothetical protein [Cyanophyceae]|uniref:hypothetical protein n=1 Tax=Cyanophyceae TaxID=3028117 RepID=UPI0016877527|nr:hypothetical protein [Trichocoleus sp. FACHB-40]MBD2001894.1 hypothetical protein [Trichocoleus sp. FACHB-40]
MSQLNDLDSINNQPLELKLAIRAIACEATKLQPGRCFVFPDGTIMPMLVGFSDWIKAHQI